MPATKARPKQRRRDLTEQVQAAASPLQVDREAGIIYGVKVLGRYSRNCLEQQAENGTEYSVACMDNAVRRGLYEGVKVRSNHPPDRHRPGVERDVNDSLGVLRNVRRETGKDGEPGLYADLHYLKSHPLAESVVEDVERGLGVYGLSHNAAADRERFDQPSKRIIIESLALVRSVDLVDKPATNRNLWESERVMSKTLRELLAPLKLSKARAGWRDRLLEMDEMSDPMDAPVEEPSEPSDPDAALKDGFRAAILACLDDDSMDAAAKIAKIKMLLTTHEKLTQSDEPEEVLEMDEDEEKEKEDGSDLKEGLGDGSSNQKGQWAKTEKHSPSERDEDGDVIGYKRAKNRSESLNELHQLRTEKKVRQLCESCEFTPSELQLESLCGLADDTRRKKLIAEFKAAPAKSGQTKPRTYAPTNTTGGKARNVTESEFNPAEDLALLRG